MKNRKWRLARFFGILALVVALLLVAIMRTIQQTAATNSTAATGSLNPGTTHQQTTQKRVWEAGSDWTMYLHDIQRTGASSETILSPANVGALEKVWAFKTGDAIAAQPIIVDQTVYVGSWDGYEYALDALTGALKWKTFLGKTVGRSDCNPIKAGVSSSATVEHGVVYVGGGADYWYALSAKTGAILWKVYTGDTGITGGHYNWSSPLIYNGYAYIGIASMGDCPLIPGELLKVSLATHQIAQVFNTVIAGDIGGGIWSSPSVDTKTNTIYIASGTESKHSQILAQTVYSLDATTLALKQDWKLPLAEAIDDSDFDTSPTLFKDAKGDLLVASINKNGKLYVFQRNNIPAGPIDRVRVALPGNCPLCEESTVSSTAFGQGTLFMAGANVNLKGVNYRGSVSAWNPTTGKFLWQRGEPGPVFGALTYDNGLIFDGEGGTVEALNAKTGARLWSYQTPADKIFSPASVSHGMVFTGDTDGNIYAFGLPVTPAPTPARDPNCPEGWTCQDIGNPIFVGTEKATGTSLTTQADGIGHGGTTDQLRLMSREVSGDAQLSAEIVSGVQRNIPGQAGLMMRETNAPGSPDYTVLYTGYGVIVQYRVVPGQDAERDIQLPNAPLPLYLEIQRTGDLFQAAYSTDGSSYTLIPGSSVTLVLPTTLLAGPVADSGHNGVPATITYQHIAFGLPLAAPGAPPSSVLCPPGWQCSDIGNPALQGSQTLAASGSWTLQGAGSDLYADWDQCHFVARFMDGNGSIVARVSSPTLADPWSKAGIMLRENNGPNAPFYGIFLTPTASGNGIEVLDRTQPRLIVTWVGAITGKGPIYLKITRVNNIFSASISDDGAHWIDIQGSATPIAMSNTILAGMTITSHNPSKLSNATFDHLSIS